jgi:basic membrane protein A and related proteins
LTIGGARFNVIQTYQAPSQALEAANPKGEKMKKLISILIVLALVAPVMVMAGGQQAEGGEAQEQETEFKIAIAFDVGGLGDQSFNDSAYRGLRQVAEEYNGYVDSSAVDVDYGQRVQLKFLEPQEGGQDREQLLRILAEDGYNLIFGVGFAYTDVLGKVAADFPDVHFGLIDGFLPDLTAESNITSISFAEHEGSFLVGALAAMVMEDQGMEDARAGYVGGMDIPLIHKFHAGYMAGAMYVDPDLREDGAIMGQYIGQDPSAFADPQTAEQIARNMYNNDAGIVYHAAGASGAGVFQAASDLDKWAIGVDSDQGLIYAESDNAQQQAIAEHILTSMLKRVDQSVFLLSQEYIENDGSVDGGYVTYGLADDGVGVAVNEYNQDLVEPYMAEIEELKQMVIDGEISVPQDDANIPQWKEETF